MKSTNLKSFEGIEWTLFFSYLIFHIQESVSNEVASVLKNNPLTIHSRRKVAIDEELPTSPLLPSPLTPEASKCTLLHAGRQSRIQYMAVMYKY